MARAAITGIAGAMKELRALRTDLKKRALREVREAVLTAQDTAMNKTPVWSGEAVLNYRWGVDGSMPSGTLKPAAGDPGPTNSMGTPPAGEPQRAGNQARAYAAAARIVNMRDLRNYTLVNTIGAQKWDLIDSGIAPGGPGQVSRGPGGYMKLAQQSVRMRGYWK